MGKAIIGCWLVGAAVALPLLGAVPAVAQETPSQFDAANAEARRYSEIQNRLRNQAHDLRNDRARGLLQCQGAGAAAAQNACAGNLEFNLRRRGLELNNQSIQQQNSHNLILKGIGVHRVP
ncbi:hypothetical protein [Dongia sp.]|uniref:hypothetical protein n=1 Tax=Dongia sp. TaxID=1977262 RepID=UPI0037514CCD